MPYNSNQLHQIPQSNNFFPFGQNLSIKGGIFIPSILVIKSLRNHIPYLQTLIKHNGIHSSIKQHNLILT